MATQAQQKEFIAKIAPLIQKEAKKRGYKVASAIIAQAICESGWGLSSLAAKYHNYFGMKCGGSWKGASVNMTTKEEYTVGTLTTIKDNFRAYESMEAGVAGYFDFISYSRYANLKTATDAKDYLEKIKADGYATSSTYVQTNMNIVNKYNLTVWDNFDAVSQTQTQAQEIKPAQTKQSYIIGKNYTLDANMYVRVSPRGAKKQFSQLTEDGKRHGYKDGAGAAILKKGTIVTVQAQTNHNDGSIWLKIPSGYVCAVNTDGSVYIK